MAAADALIRIADERPGSLIVVGSAGLNERAERVVGNVPHQLTHHSHADLMLVGYDDSDGPRAWGSAALATDGSPTAATRVRARPRVHDRARDRRRSC